MTAKPSKQIVGSGLGHKCFAWVITTIIAAAIVYAAQSGMPMMAAVAMYACSMLVHLLMLGTLKEVS